MKNTPTLEINFLQKNQDSPPKQPIRFNLTILKNGLFTLSNFADYYNLFINLSEWIEKTNKLKNSEGKYDTFLRLNRKFVEDSIDNSIFWKDFPYENQVEKVSHSVALKSNFHSEASLLTDRHLDISQFKDETKRNIEKLPANNHIIFGCKQGHLYEYSVNIEKIVNDFGKSLNGPFWSMAATYDGKSLFLCDQSSGFKEFDLSTYKEVKNFNILNPERVVVTYDNQFLITTVYYEKDNLTKWSLETKKKIHTWSSNIIRTIYSQTCTFDSKFQFIGYDAGFLAIFDLKKNQTVKTIEYFQNAIESVAISRDNLHAYISDTDGNIAKMKWDPNASTRNDFKFTKNSKVGTFATHRICLSSDEKNLFVGSCGIVRVFSTQKWKITKEFNLTYFVSGLSQVNYGQNVIVIEQNGNMTTIDVKTLEIQSTQKNVANGKRVLLIEVIKCLQ